MEKAKANLFGLRLPPAVNTSTVRRQINFDGFVLASNNIIG